MTTLRDKDFKRKIRQGNREIIISLSSEFLREKNLKVGNYIDLRNLEITEKPKKGSQEKS